MESIDQPVSKPVWYPAWRSLFSIGQHAALAVGLEGRVVELDGLAGRVLGVCQGCRTLEGYAAAARQSGLAGDQDALSVALERLVAAGLLREWDGVGRPRGMETPASAGAARPRAMKLATAVVVTADRPAALRRCLQSLVRQSDRFGHHLRFAVIDGSRNEMCRAETKAAVLELAAVGHRAEYVDSDAVAALRARLGECGIPAPLAASAAALGSIGANRNVATLLTAGERVLTVDDDVVFDPWAPAGWDEGLEVGGHLELREWAFFASREEARRAARPADVDLFTAHDELLGARLDALLRASRHAPRVDSACRHLIAAMTDGQERVVRATFAGMAGDAGAYCPSALLFSPAPIRGRLVADRRTFETALGSREVHRVAVRRTIVHNTPCVACCMGLSNETLVAPFMTVGRNEDGVFGAMLSFADPTALFAYLPYGVYHESNRPAAYGHDRLRLARETRLSDLLLHVIDTRSRALAIGSVAERLRALGAIVRELGYLDAARLARLATDAALSSQCQALTRLEAELDANPHWPDYYRAAFDEYQQTFRAAVADPAFFLPIEFRGAGGLSAGFDRLAAYLREFGALIEAWPDIWEAARRSRTT